MADDRTNALLEVAKSLASELDTDELIKAIIQRARDLLDAEVGSVFLVDHEKGEVYSKVTEEADEIRIPITKGIAGHVASTGELLTIADAYRDERFNPEVDRRTGFRTRNILCTPLKNSEGRVIGVTQIINKRGGLFSAEDEQIMLAFSAQAAIALENSLLFQQTLEMRNYLESVLKSINNLVLTLNDSGRLVTSNRPTGHFLGVEEAVMRERPYPDWFGAGNEGLVADIDRVYGADPEPVFVSDYDLQVANETRALNYNILPLLDFEETRKGVVVVMEDITSHKRVMSSLTRHVGPTVAQKILQEDEERLGGVRQDVTILFSDIRGYTSLTETMDAADAVAMLNEYFTRMVDSIFSTDGVLDKFIGDAIMATFGNPYPSERDPENACRAAVRMQRALGELNALRRSQAKQEIRIGIGINSGSAITGNIGSEKQIDYTCIGDCVNIASRLEGATKQYGVTVLVSESTHDAVRGRFITRELDIVQVIGKQQPIRIYELLGDDELDVPANLLRSIPVFEQGLKAYRSRDFESALRRFTTAQQLAEEDRPAQVFADRCRYFLRDAPPASDWDGVWVMKEK